MKVLGLRHDQMWENVRPHAERLGIFFLCCTFVFHLRKVPAGARRGRNPNTFHEEDDDEGAPPLSQPGSPFHVFKVVSACFVAATQWNRSLWAT